MEKVTIEGNGFAVIEQETGEHEGRPTGRRWELNADQVAKHLPMFHEDAGAVVQIAKGDADALRDVAREAERKRERGER